MILDRSRPFAEVCPPQRRVTYRQDNRCFNGAGVEVVPDPRDPEHGDFIPVPVADAAPRAADAPGMTHAMRNPAEIVGSTTVDAAPPIQAPATEPAALFADDDILTPSSENPIQESQAIAMPMKELRALSERYNGRTNTKANCIADLITAGVIVPDADAA